MKSLLEVNEFVSRAAAYLEKGGDLYKDKYLAYRLRQFIPDPQHGGRDTETLDNLTRAIRAFGRIIAGKAGGTGGECAENVDDYIKSLTCLCRGVRIGYSEREIAIARFTL